MGDTSSTAMPGEDTATLVGQIIELAASLCAVLGQETALVRAMHVKEIGPLQREKTSLTEAYRKAFKALTARQSGSQLAPPLKERLQAAGQNLAKAVRENEMMLRVGQAATERLIVAIVTAVNEQRKAAVGYAPKAKMPRGVRPAAIDRRL
jgi:hypothetical protein